MDDDDRLARIEALMEKTATKADLAEAIASLRRGRPIETAPARPGGYFGPVLLWAAAAWTIGCWNGAEWGNLDGELITPTHWYPLPAVPR